VWVDESYDCDITKNETYNYTDHAIAVAFLQGGSIRDNKDDGSGVIGTNHAITDSYQYVAANYTGVGLGAGSLRDVVITGNQSNNRIYLQHAGDANGRKVIVKNNFCGIDCIREQNGRVIVEDNPGSLIQSGLDHNSIRNGERSKSLTLTSISGTFTATETVTGGTSSAVGYVVSFSGSTLKIRVRRGTFAAAEVVTGGSSGATGTISTISTANVLVKSQTNSDDTPSRFSMLQGPTPSAYVIAVGNGSTGDQNLYDSYNCNRVEKTGTGVYKIYFTNSFANSEQVGLIATPSTAISWRQGTTATTYVTLETFNSSGVATDAGIFTALVYGILAT
jgi:hypothetical protein